MLWGDTANHCTTIQDTLWLFYEYHSTSSILRIPHFLCKYSYEQFMNTFVHKYIHKMLQWLQYIMKPFG